VTGTRKKSSTLNTLSVALKHAGNRGWVPHSAAIECVPPFAAQSEPRTRWVTLDEFPKLLATLDTTEWIAKRVSDLEPDEAERKLREHGEHIADRQVFVTVACFTGAELSALSRLDWTPGANGAHGAAGRASLRTKKTAASEEMRPLSASLGSEGRRTRPSTCGLRVPLPPPPNVLGSQPKLRLVK
jgi:hypothetical protein